MNTPAFRFAHHLAILLFAGLAPCASAQPVSARGDAAAGEPGLMLREGTWNGDVGSYLVPASLDGSPARTWPADGWHRLRHIGLTIQIEPVVTPPSARPAFLQAIVRSAETPGDQPARNEPTDDALYLRVPGTKFIRGTIKPYLFKNGTPQLSPKLEHRYELKLGDVPFAFTVQNGLRGRNGEAYGDGAHYFIEYGSEKYAYSLDGFGWDSRIVAIADLDGDGKPDFVINVGGSNSGHEYLLLSSVAKPGRNPPTASLHSQGC